MINGQFEQKLRLRAETKDGKVSAIQITGSRADPANIFAFLGTVLNVVQVFDTTAANSKPGDGTTLALVKELGLMREDSAADIGKPVIAIKPYALIKCLTMPSRVSLDVGCVLEPRS